MMNIFVIFIEIVDPQFQDISNRQSAKAQFFKVDIDKVKNVLSETGATGVPAFVLYLNGSQLKLFKAQIGLSQLNEELNRIRI